ncbi:LacI family DNA-binding transcriptional regulator [Crenobacter cavernae]|uniref:LacI family DNA-binding transcriptional regulator n=1 Tax=Crenobacter cavernae TaxID=2290923 RepID=A0ABY0FHE2_9NEIS|nr:LacI family DNA-binding transcriptional regulator [Crenobacter cavernae]RXZ44529.1 LacI family DNA-binding transcriptional regulator [Crenobacter cavernae]
MSKITDKAPSPQGRRPTILDVARAAGVSPTTVSHALNNKRYVDEKTRERVKDAVRKLGYRPNKRAQRLRTGEAQTIALISSMPFEIAGGASRLGFLMEVAAVAAAAALTRGLALVLVPPLVNDRQPLEKLDIDGAIVIEPVRDDPHVAYLQGQGLPVVCLGRPLGYDDVPYIDIHSAQTTRLLLDHLWTQGSRHIALLIGAQQRNSYVEAEATYRAFCAEHDLAPIVAKAEEHGGEAAGLTTSRELLHEHPEIDGICAPVDAFAAGALQAAQQLDRRVPEQIKVVTRYDGIRAKTSTPPLTAVDLHLEQLAQLGVQLLFDHLGGDTSTQTLEPPLPDLVLRASSKPTEHWTASSEAAPD